VTPRPKRKTGPGPRARSAPKAARPSAAPAVAAEFLAGVTARDLMREDVITIDHTAPLSEVERILVENRIGGAPVTDEAGAIIGVVSLRDLIERYTEDTDARPRRGRGWFEMESEDFDEEAVESFDIPEEAEETARDVMSAEVYSVPAAAAVQEVARTMSEHRIHRVLVESNGVHVGLVTTMDVLTAVAVGGKPPRNARKGRGSKRGGKGR
jgi:CBS domain-containing protein